MRSKIALCHSLRNEGKKRKIHVYYMYIVERDLGLDFKPWLPLTDCIILRKSPSPWVGGSGGFSFLMLKWENRAVGSGILWGFSCFSKPRKNIFSPMCPNSPGKSQEWQDGFVLSLLCPQFVWPCLSECWSTIVSWFEAFPSYLYVIYPQGQCSNTELFKGIIVW